MMATVKMETSWLRWLRLSVYSCTSWGRRQCEIAGRWMLRLGLVSVRIKAHVAGALGQNRLCHIRFCFGFYRIPRISHWRRWSVYCLSPTNYHHHHHHVCLDRHQLYVHPTPQPWLVPTFPEVICSLAVQCLLFFSVSLFLSRLSFV